MLAPKDGRVNWKSGFIRVWVVVSALWIVLIGVVDGPSAWHELVYQTTETKPPSECLAAKTAEECAGLLTKAGKNPLFAFDYTFSQSVDSDQSHVAKALGPFLFAVSIPPLGLLALGILVAWAVKGFRPASR
jgi:hypothetical protein